MPSPQSQKVAFRSDNRSRWVVSSQHQPDKGPQSVDAPNSTFRLLIVDLDSFSGDLLVGALARDRDCEAAVVSSCDLLTRMADEQVDVVVIGADLNQETKSGFELAQTVRRVYPSIPVVILLNQSTHDSVVHAFRSGARGVFSRQQPAADFLDCVDHVRKGCIWAGEKETNFLLEAFRSIFSPDKSLVSETSPLSVRELQVVQCAAKGKTNKAIASELGLSEHTVKNYLFRAFEKLGVSNRVELLFYLTQTGHAFGLNHARELEPDLSAN